MCNCICNIVFKRKLNYFYQIFNRYISCSVFYGKLKNLITMQNYNIILMINYFFGFVISLVLINYNFISYNENLLLCIFFILFFICVFKAPINQNTVKYLNLIYLVEKSVINIITTIIKDASLKHIAKAINYKKK